MFTNAKYEDTVAGDNTAQEISIYLIDRDSTLKLTPLKEWSAEYITRNVAVKHLGIGSIALEVRHKGKT